MYPKFFVTYVLDSYKGVLPHLRADAFRGDEAKRLSLLFFPNGRRTKKRTGALCRSFLPYV
jgi:hypothetical protein